MDDANFETTTANAAILRLTKELAWIEEALAPNSGTCVYMWVQRTAISVACCVERELVLASWSLRVLDLPLAHSAERVANA